MEIRKGDSRAVILEKGAYLFSLTLKGKEVLLQGKERQTRGGMALLLPFANRIKGGKYTWNGKEYSLPVNAEGNAIHGLVMDKIWKIVKSNDTSVSLSLSLDSEGYPTSLEVNTLYEIDFGSILVRLQINNIGNSNAPLTVGFHPYFIVKGLWNLTPNKGKKCVSINKIPTGEMIEEEVDGTKQYDDCFYMPVEELVLSSEYSEVKINKKNLDYVQIYTTQNAVAVEPMSGAPDAYHNGIGLKVIQPGEKVNYEVKFELLR
jgi:aldose 1-epimerase